MPKALEPAWPCWLVWLEKGATFVEMETALSIDDVDKMIVAMEYWGGLKSEGQATR